MTNSTTTIYRYLAPTFWTKRKCQHCQTFFTLADYQVSNYQLTFLEIGNIQPPNSLNYAVLAGVIVQLTHQHCPLTCGFNYQANIYQKLND